MSITRALCLATAASLVLAACGSEPEEPEARTNVLAVGSSTVYPFAVAVAEGLTAANPDMAEPVIESTGTTEGIARFCAGVNPETPDIVNASRRMTAEEFATCEANGVSEIVELQVGLDGIVFASATDGGMSANLTPRMIYAALAATPFGNEQTNANWSDVDGSLPDTAIEVYGPPATSGTRDSLIEMAMKPGCLTNGGMSTLADEEFAEVCGTLRSDGAYNAQGEHDDMVVRKVAGNPYALAVFGYSYADENAGEVQALPIGGIVPTAETITDGSYPLARPLYIYVKKAHIDAIPGLTPYIAQWAESWGPDGPLAGIGLVPSHEDELAANAEAASAMTVLSAEALGGEEG